MIIRNSTSRAAAVAAALAAGAWPNVTPAGETTGVATAGYSTCDDACATGGACENGRACTAGRHDYRCNCPECSDLSAFDRMCIKLGIKKRETLHDHSTWAINHYRHLHHPKCPPYNHPSFGYYQTCWDRFPEESLWCPECPTHFAGVESIPTNVVPIGPVVSPPPPAPAATPPAPVVEPTPVPALDAPPSAPPPVSEPPQVEDPAYDVPPAGTTRRPAPATIQYAAVEPPRSMMHASPPVRLKPARSSFAPASHERPMDPANRWRIE